MPAISTYRITRRDGSPAAWYIAERDATGAWTRFHHTHLGRPASPQGRNPRHQYRVRRVA